MDTLSSRGRRAIKPALSYFGKQIAGSGSLHSADNADGYVLMAVAENRLNYGMAMDKLKTCRNLDDTTGAYANMNGRHTFRTNFAKTMHRTVTRGHPVDPESLVASAGCGAAINNLAFMLMEPGDGVLLPTPTYGALYNDFGVLAQNVVVDVPMEIAGGGTYTLTSSSLDKAYDGATAKGIAVKMLFVIQPNNPLGIVHSEEEIRMCMRWCRGKGVHLVVDEIYANSIYGHVLPGCEFKSVVNICAEELQHLGIPNGGSDAAAPGVQATNASSSSSDGAAADASATPSAAGNLGQQPEHAGAAAGAAAGVTADRPLGDFVHVLWGFSKDFCMSGYRVGMLYTHNSAVLRACGNINYFCAVGNDTQDALAQMLHDEPWIDSFFETNRSKLKAAYDSLSSILDTAGIPYVAANAGMFAWIDLRAYLPKLSEAEAAADPFLSERRLTDELFDEAKVLFTPGEACHASEPGYFRCCFAWMQPESIKIGFERLAAFAAKRNGVSS